MKLRSFVREATNNVYVQHRTDWGTSKDSLELIRATLGFGATKSGDFSMSFRATPSNQPPRASFRPQGSGN